MIFPIDFRYPTFNRNYDFDQEELSSLELSGRTAQKVNEVIELANTVDGKITKKEDSDNITNNRKLSPTGVFSGWLLTKSVATVLMELADALTLSQTLIGMVNDRESIGTIYDGGYFLDTVPPVITIEGGLF